MKGFKFWLVAILLGLFWLTCFSSAWTYTYSWSVSFDNVANNQVILSLPIPYSEFSVVHWSSLSCTFSNVSTDFDYKVNYYYISNSRTFSSSSDSTVRTISNGAVMSYVWNASRRDIVYFFRPTTTVSSSFDYTCTISNDNINFSCPSCPECSTCDYSWYVAVDDITTNYCVSNDLCPVSTWVSWSELVINDIVHESAPLINITIPEEYSWDYSVDENEFTLDISGANVDYAYIDWIIRTQKWKPNNIDFNNVISGLIPLLIPWLVIILFIWFIFRFIKKIF